MSAIYTQVWYKNLLRPIRVYVDQAILLLERERTNEQTFFHYGFVVFPAAKAYEGYLKEYFYALGLVPRKVIYDEHFRIGKALNPDLPRSYRKEDWVYERLTQLCGEKTAELLWRAWREGRNKIFHYSDGDDQLSLAQAEITIDMIFTAMAEADACGVRFKEQD